VPSAFIFRRQFVDRFFSVAFCRSFNATDLVASLTEKTTYILQKLLSTELTVSRERGDLPRAFKIKLPQDLTLEML